MASRVRDFSTVTMEHVPYSASGSISYILSKEMGHKGTVSNCEHRSDLKQQWFTCIMRQTGSYICWSLPHQL